MIDNLKPYPEMKDSGVVWLGEVPNHWNLVRNGAVMRPKKDVVGQDSDNVLLLSLTKQGIIARDMENPEGKFPASFDTYQVIEPGDLVFCLFDIDETPRTVGLSSLHGMITSAYTRFSCPDHLLRMFVYLLYLSLDDGKRLKPLYSGLRKVIQKPTFLSAKIALPPRIEQAAIVKYLEYMDQRIKKLIAAKMKLIKLLEEQKQAIIHQAVTKGLDPNVPMKDSGVEWLGEVPKHWEIRRMKTLCSMKSGENITSMTIEPSGAYPVFGGNGIRGFSENYTHEGDYALVGRQGALCGNVHIVHGKFWASEHAVVASLKDEYSLDWFAFTLEVMNLNQYSIAAAQPGLSVDRILNLWVPAPDRNEQKAISKHIKKGLVNIDLAITRANNEVTLLNEYKIRLISDVVTGKLDVREAAASLPDEDYPIETGLSEELNNEEFDDNTNNEMIED